jgi:AbrB family looped-hinge helix DNA binding protein
VENKREYSEEPKTYTLGFVAKVSKNNRIVIPKEIADITDLEEGDKVNMVLVSTHKKIPELLRQRDL